MAKINGFEIKSLKLFYGHEGEPLCQGNLYLNGKKIGFWSQDSWGGPDSYILNTPYNEEDLNRDVIAKNKDKAIHGTRNDGSEYTVDYDLDMLMSDLLVLKEEEKDFKSAIKNGFPMTVVMTNFYQSRTWMLPKFWEKLTDEEILKKMEPNFKKSSKNWFKNNEIKYKIYRDIKDFIIGE